jgi:hypothetical protein
MKILFVNKFFFIKGGAETVYFQERDAMLQAGYQVVDFSMQHVENKPSPWEEFFVHNVDYHDSHGLMGKIKAGVDFIYNARPVQSSTPCCCESGRILCIFIISITS